MSNSNMFGQSASFERNNQLRSEFEFPKKDSEIQSFQRKLVEANGQLIGGQKEIFNELLFIKDLLLNNNNNSIASNNSPQEIIKKENVDTDKIKEWCTIEFKRIEAKCKETFLTNLRNEKEQMTKIFEDMMNQKLADYEKKQQMIENLFNEKTEENEKLFTEKIEQKNDQIEILEDRIKKLEEDMSKYSEELSDLQKSKETPILNTTEMDSVPETLDLKSKSNKALNESYMFNETIDLEDLSLPNNLNNQKNYREVNNYKPEPDSQIHESPPMKRYLPDSQSPPRKISTSFATNSTSAKDYLDNMNINCFITDSSKNNSHSQDNMMPPPIQTPPLFEKAKSTIPPAKDNSFSAQKQFNSISSLKEPNQNRFSMTNVASNRDNVPNDAKRMANQFNRNGNGNSSSWNEPSPRQLQISKSSPSNSSFHNELSKRKYDETQSLITVGLANLSSSKDYHSKLQMFPSKPQQTPTKPIQYKTSNLNLLNVRSRELPANFNKYQSFTNNQHRKDGNLKDDGGNFIEDFDLEDITRG